MFSNDGGERRCEPLAQGLSNIRLADAGSQHASSVSDAGHLYEYITKRRVCSGMDMYQVREGR